MPKPSWLKGKGRKPKTGEARAKEDGLRSGLEDITIERLLGAAVPFEYESFRVPYQPNISHYIPDFLLLANGIVIETKGLFTSDDRTKHKLVKLQHPNLDIRFVFSRSASRLSKTSATTYAKWCEKHGFLYADKIIPPAWIAEPVNHRSLQAIHELKQQRGKKP